MSFMPVVEGFHVGKCDAHCPGEPQRLQGFVPMLRDLFPMQASLVEGEGESLPLWVAMGKGRSL